MPTATAGAWLVDNLPLRAPDAVSDRGSRTWAVRGRNFVTSVVETRADDPLVERQVPDEHVLLVQGGVEVTVEHVGLPPAVVSEAAVVIVPAGTSVVRTAAPTTLVRVFTSRCAGPVARAVNHPAGVDLRVPPLTDRAGAGTGGLRVHPVDRVPAEPGRLGRIYRTADLMVNWFPAHDGPRDTERLSPHVHDDFEQLSVTLAGDYVHHLRVPWGTRMSEWRDDLHAQVGSPSMTLIPPAVVHTTRAVGAGRHVLVDVFAPPREDFLTNGWVLNAGEYPGVRP